MFVRTNKSCQAQRSNLAPRYGFWTLRIKVNRQLGMMIPEPLSISSESFMTTGATVSGNLAW